MERQTVTKAQKSPPRVSHEQRQSTGLASPVHPLLELQRSIGNQAVQRLITSSVLQTKLQISTPGDPFEREADQVADRVMRMPQPNVGAEPEEKDLPSTSLPTAEEGNEEPAGSQSVQRVPVAVREDDDEEKVAPAFDSQAPDAASIVQREVEPVADEQSDDKVSGKLQLERTASEEGEEEQISTKVQNDLPAVQMQCADEGCVEEHTERGASEPTVQREPVAVSEDEEEEKVAPKIDTAVIPEPQNQQPSEINASSDLPIRRQTRDEDEMGIESPPPVQRETREEEQEHIQPKSIFTSLSESLATNTSRAATSSVQRLCTECEEEQEQEKDKSSEPVQREPLVAQTSVESIDAKGVRDTPIRRQSRSEDEKLEFTESESRPIQRQTEDEEEKDKLLTRSIQRSTWPPSSPIRRPFQASIQRLCSGCESENDEQPGASERIKRESVTSQTPQPRVNPSVATAVHSLNGGGRPLSDASRAFFEPRFGADFSHVRIHTDARAAETAKSINARAFTFGRNIAFGGGQYAPHSHEGQRLLAHELTHTIQQGGRTRSAQPSFKSHQDGGLIQRDGDANASQMAAAGPEASSLDEQYKAAVAAPKWDEAARLLNGFSDADIVKRVELLGKDQLEPLKEASDRVNGAASHRIRGPILSRQYRSAVEERKWSEAAGHLNGLNDEGILSRVKALDQYNRTELYLGAVEAMTGISRDRIIGPIAKVDLNAAYGGAARQPDWAKAAEYLNGLSDDDINARVAALSPSDRLSMLPKVPEWAHRARAALLDAGFRSALETGDWDDAARNLNGFDDPGISQRVESVRIDALEPIIEGANRVNGAAAGRIRTPAFQRLYLNAVADDLWTGAARYLTGLDTEQIDKRLGDLVAGQLQALQAGASQLGLTDLVKRIAPRLSQALSGGLEVKPDPDQPGMWQVHNERKSAKYIDNVVTAVGVCIYLPGYLLFIPGMEHPVIAPWEYISYSGAGLASVDENVYGSRGEAEAAVAKQGGAARFFAYYGAAGGRFSAPTMFNWATTPNILRMAADATSRLQYEVQHELTIMAITMIGVPVLFRIMGRISRALLNVKEIPPGAIRAAGPKGEGPPSSGPKGEGPPEIPAPKPPGKAKPVPILGGETPDWVDLYRYTEHLGTQKAGSYWTDYPTTSAESASQLTGVPKNLIKYRLTVRVNVAKRYQLFKDAGTKIVPGAGSGIEYQAKEPVPSEFVIDVQPIK